MLNIDLSDIKTRLAVFTLPVLGGAAYAAYSTVHPATDSTMAASIPAMVGAVAGIASNLTASDLWEIIKNRGRARDLSLIHI